MLGAARLVDKLIRQAGVAPIGDENARSAAASAHTRVSFSSIDDTSGAWRSRKATEAWSDAPAQRGGAEIAGAIRSLPLELREALLLVALAGFSHAEAAEALDVPPARLLERLERARERLAAQMGADADPARDPAWRGAPHLRIIK